MMEDLFSSPALAAIDPGAAASIDTLTHYQALLYDLSLLRHKIQQMESLIAAVVSADNCEQADAVATGAVIHEMISTASSILFSLQQLSLCASDHAAVLNIGNFNNSAAEEQLLVTDRSSSSQPPISLSVIELDATALLAKYTHYCHICSKGFRRDANLRMHMRAHGDEYKTRAALAKGGGGLGRVQKVEIIERRYSCPQEGCRWNWKHEKFQPLKSVACAKNHYRRSHCPKLYVCSRCGHKEFSVLSDLHTHEKNCGNPRWRCSCGTTFSRKDKLMGHVALFVGHAPVPEGGGTFKVAPRHQVSLQWLAAGNYGT